MTGFWTTYTHDMAHRHVLLAYAFAWLLQLGYLGTVLTRSRRSSSRNIER
jgi:hypothetical protein